MIEYKYKIHDNEYLSMAGILKIFQKIGVIILIENNILSIEYHGMYEKLYDISDEPDNKKFKGERLQYIYKKNRTIHKAYNDIMKYFFVNKMEEFNLINNIILKL